MTWMVSIGVRPDAIRLSVFGAVPIDFDFPGVLSGEPVAVVRGLRARDIAEPYDITGFVEHEYFVFAAGTVLVSDHLDDVGRGVEGQVNSSVGPFRLDDILFHLFLLAVLMVSRCFSGRPPDGPMLRDDCDLVGSGWQDRFPMFSWFMGIFSCRVSEHGHFDLVGDAAEAGVVSVLDVGELGDLDGFRGLCRCVGRGRQEREYAADGGQCDGRAGNHGLQDGLQFFHDDFPLIFMNFLRESVSVDYRTARAVPGIPRAARDFRQIPPHRVARPCLSPRLPRGMAGIPSRAVRRAAGGRLPTGRVPLSGASCPAVRTIRFLSGASAVLFRSRSYLVVLRERKRRRPYCGIPHGSCLFLFEVSGL